jgi:hypothetical protein
MLIAKVFPKVIVPIHAPTCSLVAPNSYQCLIVTFNFCFNFFYSLAILMGVYWCYMLILICIL